MKRIIYSLLILYFSFSNISFAEDLWDNFGDSNIYGQEAVSDEDFQKALDSKKSKKKKDKNIPKGKEFSQSNESEIISNTSKELPLLLISLNLKLQDNSVIPTGHYQVEAEKENELIYLKLYQAHNLIAKIPAKETNDDFNEKTINFVKLLPHGDYHVQIIYGGINFNAYSIIDIEE